jgi:hypothetical protein
MRMRLYGRRVGLLAGALLTILWSLTAQTPAAATTPVKRTLTYDAVDYWRARVLRPLPPRQTTAGVDGQRCDVPGSGQARCVAALQEEIRDDAPADAG